MFVNIIKCLEEVAKDALGERLSTSKRKNWWWNEMIESMIKEKKQHMKKMATNDNEKRKYCMRCYREAKKKR